MRARTHPRRRRTLPLLVLLAAATLLLPAVAGSETTPTMEANNSCPGLCWKPPKATINAGGAVNITNPSEVRHGVEWRSGPATPTCSSGVPVGKSFEASGAKWSGSCTFAKAGTYVFFCTVHGSSMTGTVTVNSSPIPSVKSISPREGPSRGGTAVKITGKGFTGTTTVKFGSVSAPKVTVNSDTAITATSPAEAVGTVDVRVTGPGGTSAITSRDRFRFHK